nr:unnamed protein product [Callosobruchus analis]
MSKYIIEFLKSKHIHCDTLIALEYDGAAVNTGSNGGVIRCLVMKLGKALRWCICQLHANELLLRHLFEQLDGTTNGPQSFPRPIVEALKDCEQLSLAPFQSISCALPNVTNNQDLSRDRHYLFHICEAINSASCADNLLKKNRGKMVQPRWLTAANRIFRLYVSSLEQAENLLILVNFILRVYASMWFAIKTKPHYGARALKSNL